MKNPWEWVGVILLFYWSVGWILSGFVIDWLIFVAVIASVAAAAVSAYAAFEAARFDR